jgi:hypothetical protein
MSPAAQNKPIGWYVRVFTTQIIEGDPVTALYVAGYPTAAEAVAAVKAVRDLLGETYEVLDEIEAGKGPQPLPNQVRHLEGGLN